MQLLLLAVVTAGWNTAHSYSPLPPGIPVCTKRCGLNYHCEIEEKCVSDCPNSCGEGYVCVKKEIDCKTKFCNRYEICEDRPSGAICRTKTCSDIVCAPGLYCIVYPDGPICVPGVCTPTTCQDDETCAETVIGVVCKPKTCTTIKCAAGEICDELPDGPDCVPDVPTCKACRSGTNCHIHEGVIQCLPNTCAVRKCPIGLTCFDTPEKGAICAHSLHLPTCPRFCPTFTECKDDPVKGSVCIHVHDDDDGDGHVHIQGRRNGGG